MLEKLRRRALPQIIGFFLMVIGWYVSIVSVGLDKLTSQTIFTSSTMIGLTVILIGAYLPQTWIWILNKFEK